MLAHVVMMYDVKVADPHLKTTDRGVSSVVHDSMSLLVRLRQC